MAMPSTGTSPRTGPRRWGFSLLALVALVLGWLHQPIERAAYAANRNFDIHATRAKLASWPQMTTRHFLLYYPPGQQAAAQWTLDALTRALPFEEKNLAVTSQHRLTVVLYSSQAAMNAAVGLNAHANNIGYTYDGVIDILSPTAWLGTGQAARQQFLTDGPAPHELGHALLNLKADANYPAWFNEGVAQYEDWRTTGYMWITRSNSLHGPLYSMSALDGNFYALANQSRAYREGLALVQYLETAKGHRAFAQFLGALHNGQSFTAALDQVYGFKSENALFSAWQKTLR
ncbi:peptidase MA family metallohydrolase [Sulfobacillus harzensis]|uniref:Peptidase MA-like domain-containing protein n=1 Tax=Sulfobacillus harzensis TaxID=2729629 RepID=A0A7Y0L1P3_9FIRM|nr:peptidase MA family metallohydrolase [Sulfobacillus harzensis]NMP21666.1 hypothetical protein [Sulfobacillus harzensis]